MQSPPQQTTWQDDIRLRVSHIFLTFFSMDETKEYFSLLSGRHAHVVAAAAAATSHVAARKPERHRYVTTYLSNLFALFFLQSSKTSLSGWKNFFANYMILFLQCWRFHQPFPAQLLKNAQKKLVRKEEGKHLG